MPSEFEIIKIFFDRPVSQTILGVGDDAALIEIPSGHQLVISTDMLVAGRHFFPDTDPYKLGYKSLAVNLSDIAAMGAAPRWVTLALALPEANENWIRDFSKGFCDLAEQYKVDLIGGDTNRGPLNICVEIMGLVPAGKALRRDGAKAGDQIWVSGELGNAALALANLQQKIKLPDDESTALLKALYMPKPRVELGLKLREVAHSAIDISDGLVSDLAHILERSKLGARVYFDKIPRSSILNKYIGNEIVKTCLLGGGDDYELCFTAPLARSNDILSISKAMNLPLTCIGEIVQDKKLTVLDSVGNEMQMMQAGFDHFGG
jgi:thiamine-monophosphate kinase